MKVFQINTVYNTGSTGRIVADIKHMLEEMGHECFVAYGRGSSAETNTECISNKLDLYHHALMTRLTDKTGFYSKKSTERLIQKIRGFSPDIIHLHNIHGYYVNIEMLFTFLKEYAKPVVWTLHDCWAFTGHCFHFDSVGCQKWKKGCYACVHTSDYPASVKDNSIWNYEQKKRLFTSLENVQIVTPSQWLADMTQESFLGKYNVQVINNGIDRNVFKVQKGNVREKYQLQNKKIVLGVANVWSERKGLSDFIELSKMLTEEYQIVLVGLNANQIKELPNNIIGINRTENVMELVHFYSEADVYFNSSVEETMGLTTVEALACGTPVITFDKTAVPEFVPEEDGIVVLDHNLNRVREAIESLANRKEKVDSEKYIVMYDKNEKYKQYFAVYNEMQ